MQCRAARHCQGLGGMARGHEHGALLSSCLAGPVVAFGHQAAWWPGAHWLSWMVLLPCLRLQQRVLECR